MFDDPMVLEKVDADKAAQQFAQNDGLADANVPEGDDDEEELKSPEEPRSGSITADELVEVGLKQLPEESFPVADEEAEVGIEEIVEPLQNGWEGVDQVVVAS